MARTHLAFGFLAGILGLSFLNIGSYWDKVVFIALVLFAALLPDIDHPKSTMGRKLRGFSRFISMTFGHRGLLHSIWVPLVIGILLWTFAGKIYGSAIFIGYLSHLVSDGLTVEGINFLHPIKQLRLAGFIETGTVAETVIFLVVIALVVIMLI